MRAGVPLSELLLITNGNGATDPRDKIFALLGLARREDREAIRVDYTLTFQEVATTTAIYCIGNYGPDIMSLIHDLSSSIRRHSWVPNFALPSLAQPGFRLLSGDIDRRFFRLRRDVHHVMLTLGVLHKERVRNVQRSNRSVAPFPPLFTHNHHEAIRVLERIVATQEQNLDYDEKPGSRLDELPQMLVHEPESKRDYDIEELQPGVDPYDMGAIDLIAP
jgi:hypothetical protein